MKPPHKPRQRNVRFGNDPSTPRRLFNRLFQSSRILNSLVTESGKLALTCMIWPRFVAPYRWQLTRHPLPLANLHPSLHGTTILQLSDLHAGKTRPTYLAQVIDQSMAQKPDLVVLTGDLIDYHPRSLPILKSLLHQLTHHSHQPRHGILAIFGNHDYHEYSWRHTGPRSAQRSIHKRLVHIVQSAGIHLLRNQQYTIHPPENLPATPIENRKSKIENPPPPLTIVGIDEMWTSRANPQHAFQNLSPTDPVICLQHNPDGVEFLKPFPWQFMLCGHSHGGQARFPFLGALYVPMEHRHYLRGFFHFPPLPNQPLDHRTMFVSTGIGHSTPIRLNCPPEATLFTLQPTKT